MEDETNVEISVVIPVYRCKNSIYRLVDRLCVTLGDLVSGYRIILVDDGCPECSWEAVEKLARDNRSVKGVKLSRNFGQHEAITAGLHVAEGDWVVVMDCDLQDQPEEIPRLYEKALEGYDVVFARRDNRQDSFAKKIGSRVFYAVLGYLTDTKLDATVANFGIYRFKVIESVLSMRESLRYFPLMVYWVGFSSTSINVSHCKRPEGNTSYNWSKLLRLAGNVMISFSDKPLRIIVKVGFWMSFLSALSAVMIIINAMHGGVPVLGWSSLMVSLWFIGGLLMMMTGVVGIYVGKAFDEAKGRPLYVVEKVTTENGD